MPVKIDLKYVEMWKWDVEKEVKKLEDEPIYKGEIVFYGPSNFTRWSEKWGMTPLREAVVGESGKPCCVNRGFGSSCPEHQLYYYPRLIRTLEPKVLVYSATNGNGKAFGYSDEESFEIAQRVVSYALADFPGIHIYISGANPRREMTSEMLEELKKYNSWVKDFAEKTLGCYYFEPLDHESLREPANFVDDGVHFNKKGYDLYAEFFKDVLRDELKKF